MDNKNPHKKDENLFHFQLDFPQSTEPTASPPGRRKKHTLTSDSDTPQTRSENARPRQPRPEGAKPRQPRPEGAKPRQPRPENARPRQPRPENARPRQPRPENARPRQAQSASVKARRPQSLSLASYSSLIFFPAAIFYMELIFHIYMDLGIKYMPIYLFFSIAAGLVCTLLTSFFPRTVNKIIAYILTGFIGFLFCVEIICKTVLAQYYQIASSLTMAVNNKLGDYIGAIFKGIFMNILGLLLMFVPLILLATVLRKRIKFEKKPAVLSIATLVGIIFFHLLGLIAIRIPYSGDLKPVALYHSDSEIEEQVRQLGLLTMLRLDLKHSIFGVDRDLSLNDADFDKLGNLGQNPQLDGNSPQTGESSGTSAIDTSPNVLDLDFEGLSAASSNDSVKWLNQYFSSLTPTNKNKYTGMFKGYNVIFITAEGFSGYMIDKELTPTLYKMTHEGFVFNNFYTPLHYTSTSNGECQNLLGLYPKNGEPRTMGVVGTYPLDMPLTLCSQLTNLGYNSIGYHFNGDVYDRRRSHTALGYEWNDKAQLQLEINQYGNSVWPQSDEYMVSETFDLYVNRQPFNIYYLTISGHMPYTNGGNSMAVKNQDLVKHLPYSQPTKDYIAANLELEKGLTMLVNKLEAAGIADKTLIVMSPDHIPYFDLPVLEELTGQKFGDSKDAERLNEQNLNFDVYKNSLIIWSASMTEPVVVDKVCGQVDVLPTVSNLLGLNYDSRLIEGQDILSDSEGLVIFSSRSWKSDKGFYNSYTGTFTPAAGVNMSQEEIDSYVDAMKTAVSYKLQATILIQDTNYYGLILPNGAPVNPEDIIPPGSMTTNPVTPPPVPGQETTDTSETASAQTPAA